MGGFYYRASLDYAIICKHEAATTAHKRDIMYTSAQIIGQVTRSPRFQEMNPDSKIQALKNATRERTKELTSHIQHYCKTENPPGPSVDPGIPNGVRLYVDFAHSFLYCPNSKVNPSACLTKYPYN